MVKFQTTAENLAKHELASDADRAALQAVVATAQSKAKAAYTAASYADLETELAESVELLSRDTLYKAAALEQVTHLTDAVQNLEGCLIRQKQNTQKQGRFQQAALLFRVRRRWNEQKQCNALLPLVQLLPAVAAAAAVLFALPRTVPVLAAVPERLTAVVEQPVEAASSEAEEEVLPKLPYADGVYVGSSRGYGGAVRVQVTMENGSITEVEILGASHETKQFLRRAKRLLTTVVEAQSWEVDAVSEATYTSRGILGAVHNAPDRRGGQQSPAAAAKARRTAGGGGIYRTLYLPGRHLHRRGHGF